MGKGKIRGGNGREKQPVANSDSSMIIIYDKAKIVSFIWF